jgi:hypothetical protein
MTSEPDSKSGRRPPTIELTATEVAPSASVASGNPTGPENDSAAERGAAGSQDAKEAAAPKVSAKAGRAKLYAVSAALGAIATAAIVGGVWVAGYGPTREAAVSANASPSGATSPGTSAAGKEISLRLDRIEQTIQAQRQETAVIPPALGNRLAAMEAATKSLGEQFTALNRRLDDIAATSQSAVKQSDAASATADAAKAASQLNVQKGDIDALVSRVTLLEDTIKSLAENDARHLAGADDQTARLSIAAEALRSAVERGVPYQGELKAVQSLGTDPAATASLSALAAAGVPTAAALARELAAQMPALQRASQTTPGDSTFLDRLEANAQKLVRVTPVDAPAGNDPSAVVTRIGIDASRADITAALIDIAALPDTAKPLTADWVKKAEARNAAIAASRQIAGDALATLGKPAAQ